MAPEAESRSPRLDSRGTLAWVALHGAALLALVALLALGASEARALHAFYQTQERLPLWDMAGHGWGGVELQQALVQHAPLRFLDRLNRQDKWPFGYSLLLLPFLWAGGPTFAAATLLSTVLFALTPALLLWAAREVDRGPAGIAGGVLAGLAFLAAPLTRVFAVLIMRETAGAAGTALAVALYLRARRRESAGAWRLAGLATLALVFCKVNYVLLWLAAVAFVELLDLPAERRWELLRQAGRTLWPWLRRVRGIGEAGGAGAAGAAEETGAVRPSRGRIALAVALDLILLGTLGGLNAGVGIYALLLIATGLALRWLWRHRAEAGARWHGLPVAARQLLATLVLPLWIWSLSPDPIHPKTILAFLRNRQTGPPLLSPESLLYYPRIFCGQLSLTPALGWTTLVLALVGLGIAFRSRAKGWRLLAALAWIGLLLATLHPYKEPRFLLTVAPFLALLAALAASRLAFRVGGLLRAPAPLAATLGTLLLAGTAAGLVLHRPAEPERLARLSADYKLYSAAPAFHRPLAVLARWARGGRRIALLGGFNELSESLIRWRLVQELGFGPPEVAAPLGRFSAGLAPEKVRGKVERWVAEERPERILALRLLPASPRFAGADYQSYNAWQLAALRALETDPAWTLSRRRAFAGIEVEVLLFERRRLPGAAGAPAPL